MYVFLITIKWLKDSYSCLVCVCLNLLAWNVSSNQFFVKGIIVLLYKSCPKWYSTRRFGPCDWQDNIIYVLEGEKQSNTPAKIISNWSTHQLGCVQKPSLKTQDTIKPFFLFSSKFLAMLFVITFCVPWAQFQHASACTPAATTMRRKNT